jgi:hypothetical protein
MRSLLPEFWMQLEEWTTLFLVFYSVINHTKSARRGVDCFIFFSNNFRFHKNYHQNDSIATTSDRNWMKLKNCDHQFVGKTDQKRERLVASKPHAKFAVGDFVYFVFFAAPLR